MDSVRWENDDAFRAPALSLTIRSCWEHYLTGSGVKSCEEFLDQTTFDATSFTRWNQVADNRFEPRILVYAKNHTRSLEFLNEQSRRYSQVISYKVNYEALAEEWRSRFAGWHFSNLGGQSGCAEESLSSRLSPGRRNPRFSRRSATV